MQLIFDHIASMIVFSAVVILLLSTQIRAQQSSTEQTVSYMARKQALSMAEIFEQELALLGTGTPQAITDVDTNVDGETTSFVFWREDEFGADMEVEYRLDSSNVIVKGGDEIQLYRFRRFEDGAEAGGGSSSIRSLRIEPLSSGGTPTTPANARLIRIRLVNAYPMGDPDEGYIFETFWGITLRPSGLD